jgi:hypothetical protein
MFILESFSTLALIEANLWVAYASERNESSKSFAMFGIWKNTLPKITFLGRQE